MFFHGRTETVRSLSLETVEFCKNSNLPLFVKRQDGSLVNDDDDVIFTHN